MTDIRYPKSARRSYGKTIPLYRPSAAGGAEEEARKIIARARKKYLRCAAQLLVLSPGRRYRTLR